MTTYNEIQGPQFDDMDIGQLRQYASHLRVVVPKTSTKDDIKELIRNKLKGKDMAVIADGTTQIPPGHAKIRLSEDPTPGSENLPVYFNANGYICTIPRGIEVIVPKRIVNTLNDAVSRRRVQTESRPGKPISEQERIVQSYPFQVIEMTPGPEPLTKLEISKLKSYGPRVRYRDMFGRWPRNRDLARAIEQGLIKLDVNEELSDHVAAAVDSVKSGNMIED